MTAQVGQVNSYLNTVPDRRMVSDRILMLEPSDIVTYLALGTDVGKFNFTNREGKIYEWLTDTFNPVTDTVTSGLASSSTTTTFTPATANLYQPGDVLLIGTEQIWVSAVASGIPTVTRGFGSTTKATHANASAVSFISRARIDGDDADNSPSTEIASNYNYTQIFQRTIEVARSKEKLAEYGVSSWESYMTDKYMKEQMMLLNKLPFYGKRYAGTASAARTAGGLRTFVTNNLTDCSSAALTRKNIDDTAQNIWSDGGNPSLIITGAFAQRKINDFYEGFVETTRDESMGGILISKLRHPITGSYMDIKVDRFCPTNELWMLMPEYIAFYAFDPFFVEKLAKTGDANKSELVGEYGFVCTSDAFHGLIHSFSTSA
jgi:hypothetical protein